MTEALAVALVVAVAPTLAATAALIASVRNGRKADAIHVLVNSNLDAVKAELEAAKVQIAVLSAVILERTEG